MVVVNVKPYRRRSRKGVWHKVGRYKRRYAVPRGRRGKKIVIPTERTRWLKDSEGHFVGRASEAKPKPRVVRPVEKSGWDRTNIIMEKNYGRHVGRTKSR